MKRIILIITILLSGTLFIGCMHENQNNETMMDEIDNDSMRDDNDMMDNVDDNNDIMNDIENQDNMTRVIRLDAFNFGYSQTEITVKEGEKIRLELSSTEGNHNFVVDELGIETPIISIDETTIIEFTPTTKGTYFFYCSVGNHRAMGMEGILVVE